MNYCFLARPCLDLYCPKIYLDIKKRYDQDAKGVFIVMNDRELLNVKKLVHDGIVYVISDYIEEHWSDFSLSLLCKYEEKYECAPIWKYIYTDRFLINRDYEYAVKITTGLFSFFEYIFSKHQINIYYSESIATLLCYVAYIVGRKMGVTYYSQTGARGKDATHHYIINEPFVYISHFDEDYKTIEYSKAEINVAEQFLSEFERKEILPSYSAWTSVKPSFKFKYLLLPIYRLIKRFDRKLSNPYSYIYYKSYINFTDPLLFYLRYKYCKKFYKKADFSCKYVYYPLHYQPEASTIVCAQKYEKQLFFIDSWAKSLPADTVLYVKEHYAVLGNRSVQFYKELKKYPNVVLIDPWESSRKLILNSIAVTTLTGTAGWEAFLLHKPVFVGGNVFYDNAPGVIKVDDIYDHYLDYIKEWVKPDRNDVIKYLCAYFRRIKPGVQCGYGSDVSDTDENIKCIVDSLMSDIYS